jgi:isopenicillin N synthase-like dioxygenase
MTQTEDIPVIDLSQNEEIIVAQLMDALTSIGFCTLVHHGVDDACFERAFDASKSFFDLTTPIKTKYKFQGHDSNRGYLSMACETHDQTPNNNTQPDSKETLDIGKEDEPGYHNEWPEELQDTSFRNDLLDYFQTMDGLLLKLMKWIGIGLQLPDPERLVQACNGQHENLRLLHYPAASTNSSSSGVRGNVHTDFGTLTLLLQDQVGGLQVQNLDGTWISVTPVPNAIVLNVGDMLMRWTNDVLKATPHQVITPSKYYNSNNTNDTTTTPERYSIAFFCNANKETMIDCLEMSCCQQSSSSPSKYPPISSHEYLTKRLTDTIQSDKQKPSMM